MGHTPTVLEAVSPVELLDQLLQVSSVPATLIVCTSRASFIQQLVSAPNLGSSDIRPTLQNLALAQNVTIAYCTSVFSLHAYLTAHAVRSKAEGMAGVEEGGAGTSSSSSSSSSRRKGVPLLVVLGMVALHEATPSYSAQGLGRAFAAAVSAGGKAGQRVIFAEGLEIGRDEEDMGVGCHIDTRAEREEGEGSQGDGRERQNPWKACVPILNATTKSFGPGQRGWVGRTVEVKRIAERWCQFSNGQGRWLDNDIG